MTDAIRNLISSRKGIIVIATIVSVVVLAALGRLEQESTLEFLKWIVAAWLGAQAYEDAAIKSAAIKTARTSEK